MEELVIKVPAPFSGVEDVGFTARYPVDVQGYDTPAGHFYRVRVGRVTTQQEAEQLASQLASENALQIFVVRLDGIQ